MAGIIDQGEAGVGGSGAAGGSGPVATPGDGAVSAAGETPAQVEAGAGAEGADGSDAAEGADGADRTEPARAAEIRDSADGPVDAAEPTEAADAPEAAEASETVETAEAADAAELPRKRRIGVVLVFAALALALDITSKALVVAHLQDRGPIHVTGGFLNLILIRNSGAAFSIGEGQTWVFTLIAAGVVFVILRVSRNLRSLPWAIALGLLLGGALGNLSDRLFRSPGVGRGDVVDFLQFPTFPLVHYDFPVFNLADTAIVIGGCLMVLLSFLGMQPDGSRHKEQKGSDAAG
ncbi:lipoprotein signal peptidase [Catenulispora acidiphila DSM 44928]|uniref:Lipoprotein signal peptidase n=2 Tax=Catenulispora TaxID=414878 RepID=C7QCE6_CATAD|nr:lipoprotein signal peptidase [Catenulispora acidiphila DSM 44928]